MCWTAWYLNPMPSRRCTTCRWMCVRTLHPMREAVVRVGPPNTTSLRSGFRSGPSHTRYSEPVIPNLDRLVLLIWRAAMQQKRPALARQVRCLMLVPGSTDLELHDVLAARQSRRLLRACGPHVGWRHWYETESYGQGMPEKVHQRTSTRM